MSCSKNDELKRFLAGEMTPDEEAAFAGHLAACPECLEAMSSLLEDPIPELEEAPAFVHLTQLEPPSGITENIIREMLRRKRREFRQYCIRVAASSAAAIAIVFSSFTFLGTEQISSQFVEPMTLSQKMEQEEVFAKAIREFSLSEFWLEVLSHAKEK